MKKKKYLQRILASAVISIAIIGCSNFDDINTNPDRPSKAKPGWLATEMLNYITKRTIGESKGFTEPYWLSKYMLWTENSQDKQYNKLDRASFSKFTTLRNIEPMIENESDPQTKKSYMALGHFLRAWQFFQVSMRVGDIPYSEAIQGKDGIVKPKYDTQKEVFMGILEELDQANELFKEGSRFEGDFIFNGDTQKWQRLVNSFELYVLINLHKKTDDPDIQVIGKFKEVAARPLMESFEDNFALTYTGSKGYCYPWSNTPVDANSFTMYPMLSAYFINTLRENQDRRLFYVAEPSKRLLEAGKNESAFDAYEGVEPSIPYSETIEAKNNGAYSDLNRRYAESATAEPVGFLCHWDVQFILAEAAVRGWIDASAQSYYANGIKSSMAFYVKYSASEYTHGMVLDNEYIETYPDAIALKGDAENKIRQIIWQKYLAGFLHNEYQAWYEFRRTGYPEFILNPKTNVNPTDNTKFPTRWMYPQNELDYNTDNLTAAINQQYAGSDDYNGIMWLLKD